LPEFTPYTGDLADLLVPLPSGASAATLTNLTPGMTDTQRVSKFWNDANPDVMSNLLTTSQFSRSADREWEEANGHVVIVFVLQFARPSNALGWYGVASTTGLNEPAVKLTGTISPQLEASRYVRLGGGSPSAGDSLFGLALADQFCILVQVFTNSSDVDFFTLQDVAVAQYRRLPGVVLFGSAAATGASP
jgi:hypothetical protein